MNNQIDKLLITGAGFTLAFSKKMPGTNQFKNIVKFTDSNNERLIVIILWIILKLFLIIICTN